MGKLRVAGDIHPDCALPVFASFTFATDFPPCPSTWNGDIVPPADPFSPLWPSWPLFSCTSGSVFTQARRSFGSSSGSASTLILSVSLVVCIYTVLGGLKAVVVTESVNTDPLPEPA